MSNAVNSFFMYRPGALGDTLLCAPLLAALRIGYPGARLILVGQVGAVGLLHRSGLVDLAIGQDDLRLLGLFAQAGLGDELRATLGPVDVALGWLADPEDLVLRSLRRVARAGAVVAPSRPAPDSGQHVATYLAGTLERLEIDCARLPGPPLLTTPASERAWAREHLARLTGGARPAVAVHPGSGSARKNWHAAGFAAVVEALAERYAILLVAGPADVESASAVAALARAPLALAQDLPLPRLAALLAECAAFVGNDSGVGHLAALLGLPVVSLFGPTDSSLWRPWGERVRVLSWTAGHDTLAPGAVVAALQELAGPGG